MPPAFFTFRRAEELLAGARSLGVELGLEERLERILSPIRVGPLEAKNRMGIHPMEGCDGMEDGRPDALTIRRYERFGAGGAALLWFEATAILPEARMNPRQLCLTDRTAAAIEAMLAGCRAAHRAAFGSDRGLVCGLQLTHSGRYSFARPLLAIHDPALDPRKGIRPGDPVLSDDDLARLPGIYADRARLAAAIGFDFVDVKMCHRYLLSEILAGHTRPGRYGGPFENRTRLHREILRAIRAAAPGLVLAARVNVFDGVPYERGGAAGDGRPARFELPYRYGFGCRAGDPLEMDLEEPKRLARLLRDEGVGLLNVSMGNPYANPHVGRPFEKAPVDGYESPEHPLLGVARHFRATAEIQREVPDVAVMGTGYSWLREFALSAGEWNLRRGAVSIVGLGRGAIAYPDFAADAMRLGNMDRKKVCIAVSYCTTLMRSKHNELGQYPTGCVPRDGVYAGIYKESLKRKAAVPAKGA